MVQSLPFVNKFFVLFVCFIAAFLGACSHAGFKIPTPSFFHKSAAGSVTSQTGAASTPASIQTEDTKTAIPLSPGTVITIATPGTSEGSLVSPTSPPSPVMVVSSHSESIVTPRAFTPAAGPTANQIATADGIRIFYWISGALLIAACAMIYFGHTKAAIIAGAGAIVVPCLAQFLSNEWAVRALIITVCLAGGLYAAYYLLRNNRQLVESIETKIKEKTNVL